MDCSTALKKPTCIENPAFDPNDDDSLASPSFIETQSSRTVFDDKSPSKPTKNRQRCYQCTPTKNVMSMYEIAIIILTLVALVVGVSLAIRFTVFYNGSRSALTDDVEAHDMKDKPHVKSVKRHAMIPPPPIPPFPPRPHTTSRGA